MTEAQPPENNPETSGSLGYRIPGAERRKPGKSEQPSDKNKTSEILAALAVCAIVGALVDRAFGTFPWGVMGVFGFGVIVTLGASFYH